MRSFTRFMALVLLALVLSQVQGFAQQLNRKSLPVHPELVKTAMEVVKIDNFNLETGKYDTEFYLELEYPSTALPHLIDYNDFKTDLFTKLPPKQRLEISRYYLPDRANLVYYLNPHLTPREKIAAFELIQETDYFDRHFPFSLVNGEIKIENNSDKFKVTRYDLDPVRHSKLGFWVSALIDTQLDFKDFPLDRHDLSIQLQAMDPMPYVKLVSDQDIVVIPEYFRREFFDQEILGKLDEESLKIIHKYYQPNEDSSYYTIQEELKPQERMTIKHILDSVGINTQMAPALSLSGWDMCDGDLRFADIPYLGLNYSFVTFPISITRNRLTSFMKVVVPLIFMLVISMLALFVGVDDIANRLTLVTGTLLAAVMFHLSATSSLPQVGYLTLLDKLFLASYGSFMVNLILTVLIMRKRELQQVKLAERYYHLAFWVIPPLTFVLFLLTLLF